jgi:hypothetical protein
MFSRARTGFDWSEPLELPREDRHERARVVASLAEYLAGDLHGEPDRALEAMASLDEWCEGDRLLLAEALADVAQDVPAVQLNAVETAREAAKLLQLVAEASWLTSTSSVQRGK